ncbi:hypothetical protein WJX72_007530 [[Myrmecia] bisecta]|uniref:Uncharacterized protein n=1 Tax=[Myrmecia] bisecta TaxID=41462 RepID=A0AAW1QRH5_9CHLO
MGVRWTNSRLITTLVVLTALGSGPSQGDAQSTAYTSLTATNYQLGDFNCSSSIRAGYCSFTGSSKDAMTQCDSQSSCQGFVYISSGNLYYLKAGPFDMNKTNNILHSDPATIFFYKSATTGATTTIAYKRFSLANYQPADFQCPGNTRESGHCGFNGSATAATIRCNNQSGCQGFVFINGFDKSACSEITSVCNYYYLKGAPGSAPLDTTLVSNDGATDFYYRLPASGTSGPRIRALDMRLASAR